MRPDHAGVAGQRRLLSLLERALLHQPPRRPVVISSLVLVGLVSCLDLLTGRTLALGMLTLLPVAVLAWTVGWRAGLLLGLASVVLAQLAALPSVPPSPAVLVPHARLWNVLLQAGSLALLAVVSATVSRLLWREHARASHDPLTGLVHTRAFLAALEREVARARRYHPYCAATLSAPVTGHTPRPVRSAPSPRRGPMSPASTL